MASLREHWGTAITGASQGSSIPGEFLAALIANESGGNPNARRLEPRVLNHLRRVAAGSEHAYGAITRDTLEGLSGATLELASSSLGLAQVMGYHALADGADPANLLDPEFNLTFAVCLLVDFADRFGLDTSRDFPKLFRCWNTGSPAGATFDPEYVSKGMARMTIYSELVAHERYGDGTPPAASPPQGGLATGGAGA